MERLTKEDAKKCIYQRKKEVIYMDNNRQNTTNINWVERILEKLAKNIEK